MKLYMIVSKDKYEFPVAVSDSIVELAKMQQRSYKSLVACFCKGRKPNRADYRYFRHYVTVNVED